MSNSPIRVSLIGEGAPIQLAIAKIEKSPRIQLGPIFSDEVYSRASQKKQQEARQVYPGKNIRDPKLSQDSDWLLSVNNYHHLIGKEVLDIYGRQAVNVHVGLLPEYAGRLAYQWAIRNGEKFTGVTLHVMEEAFDSGPIYFQNKLAISETDTGLSVLKKCTKLANQMTADFIDEIENETVFETFKQNSSNRRAYYSNDVGDGHIDWTQPAESIYNFIRAADYFPIATPSYMPWAIGNDNTKWHIQKVSNLKQKSSGLPGEILALPDECVGVVCGDAQVLEVVSVDCCSADMMDINQASKWELLRCQKRLL